MEELNYIYGVKYRPNKLSLKRFLLKIIMSGGSFS